MLETTKQGRCQCFDDLFRSLFIIIPWPGFSILLANIAVVYGVLTTVGVIHSMDTALLLPRIILLLCLVAENYTAPMSCLHSGEALVRGLQEPTAGAGTW